MHVEKNVCDGVIGTLLKIKKKDKRWSENKIWFVGTTCSRRVG